MGFAGCNRRVALGVLGSGSNKRDNTLKLLMRRFDWAVPFTIEGPFPDSQIVHVLLEDIIEAERAPSVQLLPAVEQ